MDKAVESARTVLANGLHPKLVGGRIMLPIPDSVVRAAISAALASQEAEIAELERVLRRVGTRLLIARQTGSLNIDWHSTLVEIETVLAARAALRPAETGDGQP